MTSALILIVRRDLTLAVRRMSDVMTTLFFFVIVVSLFPLGVGPEMDTLRLIAPGVIWVAALLASMLALEHLFSGDYSDGSLEQLLLVPQPLSLLVLGKVIAHWLVSGAPLVLMAPILGLLLGLSTESLQVLMLTLLLGTPVMSLIGAVGSALTLGVRSRGVLLALLVLPGVRTARAQTIGDIDVRSRIGERFFAAVPVRSDAVLDPNCIRVGANPAAPEGSDRLSGTRVHINPTGAVESVIIETTGSVTSPVIALRLEVGCLFILLLKYEGVYG